MAKITVAEYLIRRLEEFGAEHVFAVPGDYAGPFLSIVDKPQSGTRYSPRAATPRHGPAMRFVANLADWDDSILLIPGGESGQPGSRHYTDQFSYWFDAKPIAQPFTDATEARTKRHTLTLKPAS